MKGKHNSGQYTTAVTSRMACNRDFVVVCIYRPEMMRQQSWSVWRYLLSWWHVMTWQLWQILWGHIWMSWLSQLYLMNVQLWEIRQSRLWDCAVCVTKRWLIDSYQYSSRYYCLYTSVFIYTHAYTHTHTYIYISILLADQVFKTYKIMH